MVSKLLLNSSPSFSEQKEKNMQIFVKTLTGKTIILKVESSNNKRYKIKHRHKEVKLAVLQFYKVVGTGKVQRLRKECLSVSCGTGTCWIKLSSPLALIRLVKRNDIDCAL